MIGWKNRGSVGAAQFIRPTRSASGYRFQQRRATWPLVVGQRLTILTVGQITQRRSGNGRAEGMHAAVTEDELYDSCMPASELRVVGVGVAQRQRKVGAGQAADRSGGLSGPDGEIIGNVAKIVQLNMLFAHQERVAQTVGDRRHWQAGPVGLIEVEDAIVGGRTRVISKTGAIVRANALFAAIGECRGRILGRDEARLAPTRAREDRHWKRHGPRRLKLGTIDVVDREVEVGRGELAAGLIHGVGPTRPVGDGRNEQRVQIALFDIRQNLLGPRDALRAPAAAGKRKQAVRVVERVHGQAELLQVVGAFHAAGGFADLLYCRQKEPNQHGNDGNHDQQLNERESAMRLSSRSQIVVKHGGPQ